MNQSSPHARLLVVATVLSLGLSACGESGVSPTVVEDPDAEIEHVDRPATVRGVYVNAQAAGSSSHLEQLLALVDGSEELNTFVVDVKERGEVSYASTVDLVAAVGADRSYIGDLRGLLRTLRDHGIYPVARIVVFRDPILAAARSDLAIRTRDGGVWSETGSGRPWVDPYNREVWAYNIALAREALDAGFAEIQWDYVRFPDVSDSIRATIVFPAQGNASPDEAVEDFIATSQAELADVGAPVTADVFGRVITTRDGSGIGQDWNRLVRVTDVMLPMVYPSLYRSGNFGLADPEAEPYRTVRAAMDSAVVRLARTDGAVATIRPWLQAFTGGSTVYGPEEIRAQIQAVEDAGLVEWFFWNPESRYPADAF